MSLGNHGFVKEDNDRSPPINEYKTYLVERSFVFQNYMNLLFFCHFSSTTLFFSIIKRKFGKYFEEQKIQIYATYI